MSSQELYIEEQLVDLSDETTIAMTFQINDIGNLETRNGNYSNSFKVPKTLNNNKIFGFANVLESSTTKPYKKLATKFIDEGVEIVPSGFSIIEQSDEFYEVVVYSGNSDFFALIEGLNLRDLDFSAFNHFWSKTDIIAANPNTDVYIYPVIDYGKMSDTGFTIKTKELFPAFFVHSVIKKIVETQGWTLEGDILTNNQYINELIAWSNSDWKNPSAETYHTTELESPAQLLQWLGVGSPASWEWDNHGATNTFDDINGTPAYSVVNILRSPDIELEDAVGFVSNTFVAPTTSAAIFNIFLKIKYTSGDYDHSNIYGHKLYRPLLVIANITQNKIYTYVTMDTGVGQSSNPFTSNNTITPNETDAIRQWTLVAGTDAANLTLNAGDVCTVFIWNDPAKALGPESDWDFDMTVLDMTFDVQFLPDIIQNAPFDLSNQLPDMTQKDFMKGIFNEYAISPDAISWNKTLKVRSYEEILTNMSIAKDWSDKLTNEKSVLKYRLGNYGQRNNCLYIQDGETTQNFITKGLGNTFFPIDDETLEQAIDMISLPFAASVMEKKLDPITANIDVPLIDKLDPDTLLPTLQVSARVVMLRRVASQTWNLIYDDGSTTTNVNTDIPYCHFILSGQSDNLDFDNLLSLYYQAVLQSVNKVKVVNEKLYLRPKDVMNFDHFIPIYLKKYSAYFYVNKINNFINGRLTECELVRL